MKIYQIYGAGDFPFNGDDNIFIKVTKETKDFIHGVVVTNWRGNYYLNEALRKFQKRADELGIPHCNTKEPEFGEKISLVKSNIQGWREIK